MVCLSLIRSQCGIQFSYERRGKQLKTIKHWEIEQTFWQYNFEISIKLKPWKLKLSKTQLEMKIKLNTIQNEAKKKFAYFHTFFSKCIRLTFLWTYFFMIPCILYITVPANSSTKLVFCSTQIIFTWKCNWLRSLESGCKLNCCWKDVFCSNSYSPPFWLLTM